LQKHKHGNETKQEDTHNNFMYTVTLNYRNLWTSPSAFLFVQLHRQHTVSDKMALIKDKAVEHSSQKLVLL